MFDSVSFLCVVFPCLLPLTRSVVLQALQPARAELGSTRPSSSAPPSLYLRFPSDQETSQWINIKLLFRGIRLGNILPSNAALARARARQGINY